MNNQGRVVRKTINANPGLKDDQDCNFSCYKGLSIANVLLSLRLVHIKTGGQKCYKIEIKFHANPGLA